MRNLRILFSTSWLLLSALCIAIACSFIFEGAFKFSIGGVDKTDTLGYVYLVIGFVLAIVALGVYSKKKLSLLVIAPLLLFSSVWFVDVVTAEHLWFKYAIASAVLFILSIGSALSLWRST